MHVTIVKYSHVVTFPMAPMKGFEMPIMMIDMSTPRANRGICPCCKVASMRVLCNVCEAKFGPDLDHLAERMIIDPFDPVSADVPVAA